MGKNGTSRKCVQAVTGWCVAGAVERDAAVSHATQKRCMWTIRDYLRCEAHFVGAIAERSGVGVIETERDGRRCIRRDVHPVKQILVRHDDIVWPGCPRDIELRTVDGFQKGRSKRVHDRCEKFVPLKLGEPLSSAPG